jgi:hypothetical protein
VIKRILILALLGVAAQACVAHNLQHVGYTASDKVWYHWAHSDGSHSVIVCDVQSNGSETNCKETDI